MLSFDELAARWMELGRTGRARLREIPCHGSARTLLLAEIGAEPASPQTIALSAGVHGDEPAAPWALLSLAESGFDSRFSYRIWPCTNPTGYRLGTRANAEGSDVNRSFAGGGLTPEAAAIIAAMRGCDFTLSIDLHEDCDADGFYCFERYREGLRPIGSAIVGALDAAKLPIQRFTPTFDFGYPASAERAFRLERGYVLPDHDEDARAFDDGAPYSVYVFRTAAQRTLTNESPRGIDWETRVAMHCLAVRTAIEEVAKDL